jgi:uncharacterized iron-regulated membrane protein
MTDYHIGVLFGILAAIGAIALFIGSIALIVLAQDAWRDHRSAKRFKRHLDERRASGKLY